MEKTTKDVVNVTTKKKYVKPDFEIIELNMEAPLLSASGEIKPQGRASFGNGNTFGESLFGSNE